mgnify:CR=1 FL=1
MTKTINNENKKLNFSNEREQSQACLNSAEHEKNQGQKVLNVPNLRFPEFQGEWEKCKLADVCSFFSGGTPSSSNKDFYGGNIPFIRSGELHKEETELFITQSGYENSSAKMVEVGDLLLAMYGATSGDVAISKIKGAINQAILCIRTKHNNKFIESVWNKHVSKILIKYLQGGQGNLSADIVKRISFSLPSLVEQEKISHLMQLIDDRIATQNKIIEDLKKLKCAIIEKLYEEVKGTKYFYRQLFNIINERNKQLEYSNVLSASQEKGMVSREDLNLDIQFERSNINTYKIVRNGDYVIHLRSFQGGFAFSEKTGICSPAYTVLRPNNLLVYGYLSNYFTSRDFVKSLIIVTYGIRDGRSINVDEWLKMKVVIPPKEQQTHIANVIESIENKIKNEETYSNFLLNQKQYLLHQMFI